MSYYKLSQHKVITRLGSIIRSGLPHRQEKSEKTKKNYKIQEKSDLNGGFWKKSGNIFRKHQNLSVQVHKIPYTWNPLNDNKLKKNLLSQIKTAKFS